MIFHFLIFILYFVFLSLVVLNSLPSVYSLYFGDNISLVDTNKTSLLSSVQLAATENGIYIVWVDKSSLYFSSSLDNGTSFNKIILSNITSFASSPQIAATEKGNVYVAWVNKKNSTVGEDSNIAFRWSNDAGKNFSNIKELDKNPYISSLSPEIAATEKGNVYVAWVNKKNSTMDGDTDISLRWSKDAGKSFNFSKLVKGAEKSSLDPQLAATEKGNVYMVWIDKKNSTKGMDSDVVFMWNKDAGENFHQKKLSRDPDKTSVSPQLATTEKGNVYVVWVDKLNSTSGGDSEITLRWSKDAGENFGRKKLSEGLYIPSLSPQLAATESGPVYVVWEETNVKFKQIIIDYKPFYGETITINNNNNSKYPQLTTTEKGDVYVAWLDKKNGTDSQNLLFFKKLSNFLFD